MASPDPVRAGNTGREHDLRRLLAANEAAVAWFRGRLAAAEEPRRYLTSRALGALVDREWPWRVGYAPRTSSALTDHLRELGFTPEELVVAGLSRPTRDSPERLIDVFRDRIVFPIRDPDGHVVAFIGRASNRSLAADPQRPKYLNTRESPLYRKNKLLFGVAEQQDRIRAGWRPVLVEGPADTIAIWLSYSRFGLPGAVAVAPCGTAFGAAQAAILRSMPGGRDAIVVAFDGDPAGRRAADAAFDLLRQSGAQGRLLAAEFATGADPADLLIRPNGRAQLRAALRYQTRPLLFAVVDHHLDRLLSRSPQLLDDIGGRYEAARILSPRVLEAADPGEAYRLAQHIVERTRIAERSHDGIGTVMAYAADGLLHRIGDFPAGLDSGPANSNAGRPRPIAVPPLRSVPTAPRALTDPSRPEPAYVSQRGPRQQRRRA
ncbi:toprim domain-containing protein [Micromonospora echinofusca]|uniref:toprim domain-containing protein n=1 Tax=Micromonospora echinofusca TaxID=47858 RepID=UPI00379B5D01